jgi:hypothetical protein
MMPPNVFFTSVKLAIAPPTMMFLIPGNEHTLSVNTSTAQSGGSPEYSA